MLITLGLNCLNSPPGSLIMLILGIICICFFAYDASFGNEKPKHNPDPMAELRHKGHQMKIYKERGMSDEDINSIVWKQRKDD